MLKCSSLPRRGRARLDGDRTWRWLPKKENAISPETRRRASSSSLPKSARWVGQGVAELRCRLASIEEGKNL